MSKPAPAFNPKFDLKGWADPGALASPRRSVVYDVVSIGSDGLPFVDTLVLPKEAAAAVNFAPANYSVPPNEVTPAWVPVPIDALHDDEELTISQLLPGLVVVRNKNAVVAADQLERAFLPADRVLLQAIARKLGVSV